MVQFPETAMYIFIYNLYYLVNILLLKLSYVVFSEETHAVHIHLGICNN